MSSAGSVDLPFEPFPDSALDASVWTRFQYIAGRFPGRLAVQDMEGGLTYAEIAAEAGRVLSAIDRQVDRQGPVAVLLRHEARYSAVVLGVLASGRPCIPLDANHPVERNRQIATSAAAAAVISAGDLVTQARTLFPDDLAILDVQTMEAPSAAASAGPGPRDVACIIYTSGSTGAPKGVYQNHQGVLHDIQHSVNTGRIGCEDRIAMVYSPASIAGLRTGLTALLTGASLHILAPTELGGAGLVREIQSRRLTLLRTSPTLLRHIVAGLDPGQRLDSIREVLLGGERVDWSDVDVVRRGFPPGTPIAIHLGATECWTLHSHWYVDEALRRSRPNLPVGRAIPDRAVTLMDDDGQPAPAGETGEIVVSSRYIALGYWREPDLTSASFAVDGSDPDVRIYRTGDLARRRPDGLVEFVGRKDQQLKLHGHKIEPGEVEAAIRACPGVHGAAVVVRKSVDGEPRALVGYVELKPDVRGLLPRHLMAMLSQRLPSHLAPAQLFIVDALPWLPNFKIDRVKLAQLDADRRSSALELAAEPLQIEVANAFGEVLGEDGASPEDNLLSLGGDSLQAVEVAVALERRFGVKIEPEVFRASETIRDLARWIGERRAAASADAGG